MKYCAIVTVDLQNAAANKHEARKKAVAMFLPDHAEFLQKMRKKGIPVIHTQQIFDPTDTRKTEHLEYKKLFKEGSEGAQILGEVWDNGDMIVVKRRDSAFYETTLAETLKSLNVDTIILTGMQSQICVQTTAADASFRGYEVIVPADGVSATKEEDITRSLEWMAKYVATVITQDEIYQMVCQGQLTGLKVPTS